MSATALAVTAILAFFLCAWMLMIIRDPKRWRLWWLDLFGVIDVETTREQRRQQEGHMAILAYNLLFLLLATGVSCSFWTFDKVRLDRNGKTTVERDLEYTRQYVSSQAQR